MMLSNRCPMKGCALITRRFERSALRYPVLLIKPCVLTIQRNKRLILRALIALYYSTVVRLNSSWYIRLFIHRRVNKRITNWQLHKDNPQRNMCCCHNCISCAPPPINFRSYHFHTSDYLLLLLPLVRSPSRIRGFSSFKFEYFVQYCMYTSPSPSFKFTNIILELRTIYHSLNKRMSRLNKAVCHVDLENKVLNLLPDHTTLVWMMKKEFWHTIFENSIINN